MSTRIHSDSSRRSDVRRASNRLAIQTAVLLVVLLALISGAVLAIVSASQSGATNRLLADATQNVDSVRDAPSGVWLAIDAAGRLTVSEGMPHGLPDRAAMAAARADPAAHQLDVAIGGMTYTVRTQRSHGRIVQAVFNKHENDEEIARLTLALLITGVGAVVLASVLAAWLSRRVMRPMQHALDLQTRFVADASHELRTPLTILSTRAQLLRRELSVGSGEVSATALSDATGLVDDAQDLSGILDDLLMAADPRDQSRHERVDVVEVARDVVRTFQASAQQNGVTLDGEWLDETARVMGARRSLRRVLVALVDNALEFAHSSVQVSVSRRSATVIIEVSDDGPGFPEDVRDSAFDRFAHSRLVDEPDDRPEPRRHYGLGLALVSEIAARIGGSVEIGDGEPGASGGATVRVRLPAADRRR